MQYQTSLELEPFIEAAGRPATRPTTLIQMLDQRALQQPDELDHTFLLDGETRELHLTYGELERCSGNRRSRTLKVNGCNNLYACSERFL